MVLAMILCGMALDAVFDKAEACVEPPRRQVVGDDKQLQQIGVLAGMRDDRLSISGRFPPRGDPGGRTCPTACLCDDASVWAGRKTRQRRTRCGPLKAPSTKSSASRAANRSSG